MTNTMLNSGASGATEGSCVGELLVEGEVTTSIAGVGVAEGVGVGEGLEVGSGDGLGLEVANADGVNIGCSELSRIEALNVAIKPALS